MLLRCSCFSSTFPFHHSGIFKIFLNCIYCVVVVFMMNRKEEHGKCKQNKCNTSLVSEFVSHYALWLSHKAPQQIFRTRWSNFTFLCFHTMFHTRGFTNHREFYNFHKYTHRSAIVIDQLNCVVDSFPELVSFTNHSIPTTFMMMTSTWESGLPYSLEQGMNSDLNCC